VNFTAYFRKPLHPQAKMDNRPNAATAMADLAQQATTLATAMGYVRGVMEQLETGGEIPPLGLANRLEKKFSSLHEEWAELVVKAQFIPTLEAELQASLKELATEKEAALKQRAAVDAAELDSRSASTTTRDAELGRLSVSLDRRAAALDTLDALIQKRIIALQGQETAISAKTAAMDARDKAVRDRETSLASQEAEMHTRIGDLQTREALVATTLADLKNRKSSSDAAHAKAMTDLDSRENQLASKVADLEAQETRLAHETAGIESRETQLNDMTAALKSRETQLASEVAAVKARAAKLKDRLDDIESREIQKAKRAVHLQTYEAELTRKAADLKTQEAKLAARASALDAAEEALEENRRPFEGQRVGIWAEHAANQPTDSQGNLSNSGDQIVVPRKRRRADSADDQSDWSRFVSTVADYMDALSPEEIEHGKPGLHVLYYDLSILALRDSYKARWDEFVRSGSADTWHCFNSIVSLGTGRLLSDGTCAGHAPKYCLRVMLRRDGATVRAKFT
jgi:hypothetical protein